MVRMRKTVPEVLKTFSRPMAQRRDIQRRDIQRYTVGQYFCIDFQYDRERATIFFFNQEL